MYSPKERLPLSVVAQVQEEINMGDHGEFLMRSVEVKADETVQEFAERLLNKTGTYQTTNFHNRIIMQLVEPASEEEL